MLTIIFINSIRSKKKSEIIKLLTFFIGDYYA